MKDQSIRKLKVNATSGYRYQETPTITLKGKYLSNYGFTVDTHVSVQLAQDKIIIIKVPE